METNKFNFNSQVCTDKVQSERLLALGLKKETADMRWERISEKYAYYPSTKTPYVSSDIPAWSLHRLIEMMPTTIKSRYGYVNLAVNAELVQYQYYDEDYMHNECCQHFNDGTLYDNLIDCIEWLIKEGYFNKEYLEE